MSLDITTSVGLPTVLRDDGRLTFGAGVRVEEESERPTGALGRVVLDRAAWEAIPSERPAYFMYNGVTSEGEPVADPDLRFELTSIPPWRIGRECAKTLGHRHRLRAGATHSDAEVCEVVHGVAYFLLEFRGGVAGEPAVVVCVEAHVGDKVLFPPDTDHLTVNPGPEPCVFSDAVVRGLAGDYEGFQATAGAAYHLVWDDGELRFVPNAAYRRVPPLIHVAPRQYADLHLSARVPLYQAFVQHGDEWGFLKRPEAFWPTFADLRAEMGV